MHPAGSARGAAGCACALARACAPRRFGTAGAPRTHGCHHTGKARGVGVGEAAQAQGLPLAVPPWAAASTTRPRRPWTKVWARRPAGPLRPGFSAAVRACAWARAGDLPPFPGMASDGCSTACTFLGRPRGRFCGKAGSSEGAGAAVTAENSTACSGSAGARCPCVGRSTMAPSTSSATSRSPLFRSSMRRRPAGRTSHPS